jgi:GT2 family glycosyltransferase
MSRTLIFATSYIADFTRRDLVSLWAKVTTKLNPDHDILLVDSASPVDPREFLGWADYSVGAPITRSVYRFPENIGHLNITGKDGWGRGFCKGIEIAIERGYEYMAHVDSDLIFCRPVEPIIEKLEKYGVKVAMPMGHPYLFTETAALFVSVPYLKEIDFVGKYNWEVPVAGRIPEMRCEDIFGDDLFCLPLRGMRNDGNLITWKNFDKMFPYGLDFFTHSQDMGLYDRLLKKNGIKL